MEVTDRAQYQLGNPPALASPVERAVPRRGWFQKYTCFITQSDIIHFRDKINDDVEYVPDITPYLLLSRAETGEVGITREHQHPIEKKTLNWWRAPCAVRGLNLGGTLDIVQERFRQGRQKGMTWESKRLKDEIRKDYAKKNKKKIEKI